MKRLSSKKILEHPGRLLPWAACTIFILVAWLYKVIDSAWLKDLTSIYQFLAYALFILLLAIPLFLLTSYSTRLSGERQQIQSELDEMHGVASAASRRLSLVMRARQQLVEANSEADVIQWLFQASSQITSAEGASFVPLDDHGQPLTAIGFGATPIPVPDAWLEYLASPAIRKRRTGIRRA